jgi:hypothetical protein
MIESRRIVLVRHVATGNNRSAYKVLLGNSTEKIPPED